MCLVKPPIIYRKKANVDAAEPQISSFSLHTFFFVLHSYLSKPAHNATRPLTVQAEIRGVI